MQKRVEKRERDSNISPNTFFVLWVTELAMVLLTPKPNHKPLMMWERRLMPTSPLLPRTLTPPTPTQEPAYSLMPEGQPSNPLLDSAKQLVAASLIKLIRRVCLFFPCLISSCGISRDTRKKRASYGTRRAFPSADEMP